MAFWKEGKVSPKRQFRWLVTMNDELQWWAKTVTTPAYEVNSVEHDFMDNKYYYPGRVTWNTVTLTLVDPANPDQVQATLDMIKRSGYLVKDETVASNNKSSRTISKAKATSVGMKQMEIQVLGPNGAALETWTLKNPFIKSAKYGDLDYSSDELRTIEMEIQYDWAECDFKTGTDFSPTTV